MSRVRNADNLLLDFRRIRDRYEQIFRPRVAEVRRTFAESRLGTTPPLVDECLEAHGRFYIVNAFLAALNWRLDVNPQDGLPNLVPEAPVESLEKGTRRFLDYLGLEKETNNPLLVVETKRPNSLLPQRVNQPDASRAEVLSRGLAGESLMRKWSGWLSDLRDYVRSVHARVNKSPRRVVLTNGDWLILFLDPPDAFLENGTFSPNRILVFENRSDIERNYAQIFTHLEHWNVLGETPGLTPGELPFCASRDAIDRIMHGLRLKYIEQRGLYQQISPVIKVAPIIFLRSRYGAWLRVEVQSNQYDLPHKGNQLPVHLAEVRQAAMDLLERVGRGLGISIQASPLCKHYEDKDSFGAIRGVVECGRDEFLLVTGENTHYLLPEPSVLECPYHDWAQSQAAGVESNPGPIMIRAIELRSFFFSTEAHHCTHRDVATAKACQITPENRMRCGLRSGKEGQAFCEIWRFESHLCCRTCAFEDVCTKAEVFRLPCERPSPV